MRVFGRIDDANTEQLLPGAIVTLRVGDTELIEHTPSRDGRFTFDIPDETVPIEEDILTCIVEKRGYKTQTSTYRITDGDIELAVQLVPVLINWKRIFTIIAVTLACLLLLLILYYGYTILFPPKEPMVKSFEANPAKIKAGEEAVIKWETVDADNVALRWITTDADKILRGEDEVDPTGETTVTPTESRCYQLIVRDDDGYRIPFKNKKQELVNYVELQLTVIPPPPVIVSFTAKPMEINLWDSTTLEWKTTAAETVYILSDPTNEDMHVEPKTIHRERAYITKDYPEIKTAETGETPERKKELSGAVEASPLETTTFTLVAVNAHGEQREESIEVTVLEDPEIINFTANEKTIDQGESVILRWNTRAADQVFLNGERTAPRYSIEVRPDGSTPYVLTARNKIGERSRTITINVRCDDVPEPPPPLKPPRIHRFHISSPMIAPGETTMLSWVTDRAEKVFLTNRPVGRYTPSSDDDPGSNAVLTETRRIFPEEQGELNMHGFQQKEKIESIAGKPLETGRVFRVKAVDSIRVSPLVSTLYELRAVNRTKTVTWTRAVEVQSETCSVILYELENYRGDFQRFTNDAAEIGKLNNRVSSIKIIGNCGIQVFSASDFHATHQVFHKSVPRLRGTWIGDNTVSSFKIINPYGVGQ
jgi:hypothetical protein